MRLAHTSLFGTAPPEVRTAARTSYGTASSFEALQRAEAQHVIQLFEHALPPPTASQKLALLAPGPDSLAQELRRTGADVVVFAKDLHQRAREAAEGAIGVGPDDPHMRYGDVHHLCAASGSFDIAVLTSEAQPSAYEVFALREALRVVRPGGCLVWSLLIAGEHAGEGGAHGGPVAYSQELLAGLLRDLGVADAQTPSARDVTSSAACLRRCGVWTPSGDYALLALVIAKQTASGGGKGTHEQGERDRIIKSMLVPE